VHRIIALPRTIRDSVDPLIDVVHLRGGLGAVVFCCRIRVEKRTYEELLRSAGVLGEILALQRLAVGI